MIIATDEYYVSILESIENILVENGILYVYLKPGTDTEPLINNFLVSFSNSDFPDDSITDSLTNLLDSIVDDICVFRLPAEAISCEREMNQAGFWLIVPGFKCLKTIKRVLDSRRRYF
jgi:hypothetical protein